MLTFCRVKGRPEKTVMMEPVGGIEATVCEYLTCVIQNSGVWTTVAHFYEWFIDR